MKIAKTLKTIYLISLSFLVSNISFSQKLNAGPQVLSFHSDVDDTEQPYAIYIPKDFSEKKTYPLVVMLHGAGSNHRLALRRVFGKSNEEGQSDVEASLVFPKWKNVEYIVASVYARGTMGYQGIAEKDVLDMLNDVKKRFKIDENRTYLTGLSMGGGGTMWVGLTRPDIWAAIAPVCPAPPLETINYLENAFNMPVHFFQGGDDPVVKPEGTRKWVEDFKKAGAKVTYKEYPGVKHDSWVNAYKNGYIFSWFEKIKRNPFPDRIKFTTSQLKYSKAYWLDIVDMINGEQAKIEANFKNKNMLDIKTSNVVSFSVNIMEHPNYNNRKQLMLNVDGQNIAVFGLANKQVLKKVNDKWMVGKHEFNSEIKNNLTEGPMTEIISDRHIYVYGTEGNPSEAELQKRIKIAEQAADWSFFRGDFMGRVMVFPRILSDKEVRPSDIERSHLVLFGTKNTNKLIAKYADKFPFELKEESTNSSNLTFIYPNGKKYVLISSGVPFWEIPSFDNGPFGRLRTSSKIGNLTGYGDWVYYDKDLNNVISTARFDNNWKIPTNEAEKLKKIFKLKLK